MKLRLSAKYKNRYRKEMPRIDSLKHKLEISDIEGAREELEKTLKETEFKTKFSTISQILDISLPR